MEENIAIQRVEIAVSEIALRNRSFQVKVTRRLFCGEF